LELFSPEFFSALLAIIVIDLVLAGDNAIVIAMAARNLPAHLQKKAIVWGAMGAIAVRSAMTLAVVYLLNVPGLLLAGGLLLIWIAYRLINPAKSADSQHGAAANSFWGAMNTIIIADAVMGLDNVLAVAGAAHGSYLLVVLGLLISIPIVIWGSTQILKLVERFPSIIYLGAGVLAWTAAKMIVSEPVVKDLSVIQNDVLLYSFYVLVVLLVLGSGFIKNRLALEQSISADSASSEVSAGLSETEVSIGEAKMKKILIPVDGSENSDLALRHVIKEYAQDSNLHIHLFNVQPQLSMHIGKFISKSTVRDWQKERSYQALHASIHYLEMTGFDFSFSYGTGDKVEAIIHEAQRLDCNRIVIGTAKKNSLTRLIENSTTAKLLELSDIPVEVVTGKSISTLERWGIPAGAAGFATALVVGVVD